ncbi:hypothetical protein DdX_17527 [Ditylenchus destructor]|uniref:Uncharacterized protein n=1 Tax=Ditylenchus destructor TaxID=166010 RepID=A0AAD4QVQ3_9BILA|nr:hypothetical protein DdX_17527 [Ditylenchus destructor]
MGPNKNDIWFTKFESQYQLLMSIHYIMVVVNITVGRMIHGRTLRFQVLYEPRCGFVNWSTYNQRLDPGIRLLSRRAFYTELCSEPCLLNRCDSLPTGNSGIRVST